MKAVNLTTAPVDLDPANGPGMLAPAVPESKGAHARDLERFTARERALAEAGTIGLYDAKGKPLDRLPDPEPTSATGDGDDSTGGES